MVGTTYINDDQQLFSGPAQELFVKNDAGILSDTGITGLDAGRKTADIQNTGTMPPETTNLSPMLKRNDNAGDVRPRRYTLPYKRENPVKSCYVAYYWKSSTAFKIQQKENYDRDKNGNKK